MNEQNVSGEAPVSSVADFKKKKKSALIITLPSGNRVRVRRPGMVSFLKSGYLPDPLADAIQKEISKNQSAKGAEMKILQDAASGKDLKMLQEMMRSVDRIVANCVVEPQVFWHERPRDADGTMYEDIPDSERVESIVYTDEMEDEDKMFIFQYAVGGTDDLQRFRESTRDAVAALQSGENLVEAPQ